MMFSKMLAEVVSVASPGSSDGGSVPQLTVMLFPPEPCLAVLPPQPAATTAGKARAARTNPILSSFSFIDQVVPAVYCESVSPA